MAFVKEHLGKLGLEAVFEKMKVDGEPLFPLVCAIVPYRSTEDHSTEGCERWLDSMEVVDELGIRGKVSGRTLNRAI